MQMHQADDLQEKMKKVKKILREKY